MKNIFVINYIKELVCVQLLKNIVFILCLITLERLNAIRHEEVNADNNFAFITSFSFLVGMNISN